MATILLPQNFHVKNSQNCFLVDRIKQLKVNYSARGTSFACLKRHVGDFHNVLLRLVKEAILFRRRATVCLVTGMHRKLRQ